MSGSRRRTSPPAAAVAGLAAAGLGALVLTGLPATPDRAGGPEALLLVALAVAARAVAAYLLLAVVVAALPHLCAVPGGLGAVLARCAPAGVRRAVDLAVGVAGVSAATFAFGPPAGAAERPAPVPVPVLTVPASVTAGVDWPLPPVVTAPLVTPSPRPPVAGPGRDVVVVRPGDSLWAIAARHAPGASERRIAALWPRWWQANRRAIGPDPDLVQPGTRLVAPAADTGSSS